MHELRRPSPFESPPLPRGVEAQFREDSYTSALLLENRRAVFAVKLPTASLARTDGGHVSQTHHLAETPVGPILWISTLLDAPDEMCVVPTFVDVADLEQRAAYVALGAQGTTDFRFYDDDLTHVKTKRVVGLRAPQALERLTTALGLYERFPKDQYDFEIAQALILDFSVEEVRG